MHHYTLIRNNIKMLFIGNSATYVNDIPGTLVRMARRVGYSLEADSIVKGGATLSFHADLDTKHGESVLRMIRSGYDIIWLQDNGDCISCEKKCKHLWKHAKRWARGSVMWGRE